MAGAALFGAAQAGTVYSYKVGDTRQANGVGQIEYLSVAYDIDENKLSLYSRLGPTTTLANGGWFVLSPGSMPRTTDGELAIFYLDFAGGDVYAYRYNGAQGTDGFGSNSFTDSSRYIATFNDVLNVWGDQNGLNIGFDALDVSSLAPGTFGTDWTGASFTDEFGAWVHFTALDAFATEDGQISEFSPTVQSWYDVEGRDTAVPEPFGLALIGLGGVAGAVVVRLRKKRAASTSA